MRTANKSDIGRIRMVNEDRALVQDGLNGYTLAVVADGMGGHKAGDIASQTAIELIQQQMQRIHPGMSGEDCMNALRAAISEANAGVFGIASEKSDLHGMGTTVVAALASREKLYIGHIGDSRAYKLDGASITQLTEDHSLVNELLKSGQISPDEAEHHPRRNVLTRALGTDLHVEADIREFDWKAGDIVLLCSDGLTGLVHQEAISGVLREDKVLSWKADRLIQIALEAGGEDNVTVVLLANEEQDGEEVGGDT